MHLGNRSAYTFHTPAYGVVLLVRTMFSMSHPPWTALVLIIAAMFLIGWVGDSYVLASTLQVSLPASPTVLTATLGNATVLLSWHAPDNASSIVDYVIQYENGSNSWTTFADGTSTATSANVTGLENGIMYSFRVAAVNSQGQGPWSDTIKATPATLPSEPTGLSVTFNRHQFSLSWTASDDNGGSPIKNYVVQYHKGDNRWKYFSGSIVSQSASTSYSHNISCCRGVEHTYRVAAENNVGRGPWSDTINATIPFSTPLPPFGLSTFSGNTTVLLSWSAPDNGGIQITDYVIQYGNGSNSWITFVDGITPARSVNITGLVTGTEYSFRVAAVNSQGQGPWSDTAAATPMTVPLAPTISVHPNDGFVGLRVTFLADNGGSNITAYAIEYRTSTGLWKTHSTIPNACAKGLFHCEGTKINFSTDVNRLTNGVEYLFRVAAVNSQGQGHWSDIAKATPVTHPSTPTGLTATPGNTSVLLSWTSHDNGGSPITGYHVFYRFSYLDDTHPWRAFPDTNGVGNVTSTTITSLYNGVEYSFRVIAKNAAGASPWSDILNATPVAPQNLPTPAVPDAPTGLASRPDNTAVLLSWSAPDSTGDAITDYVIQYGNGSNSWTTFADGTSTATSANVTGLENGIMYSFRVAAVNSQGQGSWSDILDAMPVTFINPIIGMPLF